MSPESASILLLSLIIFLPALGAMLLMALPAVFPADKPEWIKFFSLLVTAVVFVLSLVLVVPGTSEGFSAGVAALQNYFTLPWIPSFNIYYALGLDGISFPLVILTSGLSMLAMWASWNITKHVRAYCVLFLLLETGMLGVFMALDFFLFYVFWEVMLLPMYFLIGVWGGPRREYAAIKFFLYTLVGSVLMLVAILMLYFTSDLRAFNDPQRLLPTRADRTLAWSELGVSPAVLDAVQVQALLEGAAAEDHNDDLRIASRHTGLELVGVLIQTEEAAGIDAPEVTYAEQARTLSVRLPDGVATAAEVAVAVNTSEAGQWFEARLPAGSDGSGRIQADALAEMLLPDTAYPVHTFSIIALQKVGQYTTLFDQEILGWKLQWWAFWLLLIGFLIKVPAVPVHTWLPDAHVEAPTPISMILAGVLLKMGGYGILRMCYPICPDAGLEFANWVCALGLVSMIYGAFAAMAQKDFKRLVAYSSVSHMGYVVLGFGVWSAMADTAYRADYWSMGINGAMFQMLAHGISSAGMFFMVGVLYDRVHHRNLDEFGGIFGRMPVYTGLAIVIFFAGLGLPGLCGFIGEVLVVLSAWNYSHAMAAIAAFTVILTAGYILWTVQRVYLGAEYKGPHGDHLSPVTAREVGIAVPLVVLAIVLGVYPKIVFNYMTPTVQQTAQDLAAWTKARDEWTASGLGEEPADEERTVHAQPLPRDPRPAPEDSARAAAEGNRPIGTPAVAQRP